MEGTLPADRQSSGHIQHPGILARPSERAEKDPDIPRRHPLDHRRRLGKLCLPDRNEPVECRDL